jgi:hypothetical protein
MEITAEVSAADQLQQMRVQQDALLAELEAARVLIQRRQPPAQQPSSGPPPAQQLQPQPQPQPQPQVVMQLTQPTAAQQPSKQHRSGSKNYTNEELM